MAKVYATPGVYIEEKSAFPNSAVPVATAVPAFIGYTKQAVFNKKDLTGKPTRLSSFGEYLLYFGGPSKIQYIVAADDKLGYTVAPDPANRRFLFNCMKMFFANGGSDCYIISVGNYEDGVTKDALAGGMAPLLKEPEPTMVVIPDAVMLEQAECYDLQQQMLKHCGVDMRNRFAILDVFNGFERITPDLDPITDFRNGIGTNALQWGAAYYPWVQTTIVGAEEISFTNVTPDAIDAFTGILDAETDGNLADKLIKEDKAELIKGEVAKIKDIATAAATDPGNKDVKPLHETLLAIHPLYKAILNSIREHINLLPPSGGMAGVYSMVDNTVGVWQSPANVTFGSVVKPAVNLTNDEQEDLNVPLTGKAVNAIRTFPGKGPLVWGARTLDGNSQDWRYVSVRRTVIFIEQSIKYAAEAYVFEPNTAATWTNIKALLVNFLTNTWQQGALAGATAEDAFSVDVGLGVTMTPVDILDGIMRISVKIAVTRPAEFIVITFQQKMQQS